MHIKAKIIIIFLALSLFSRASAQYGWQMIGDMPIPVSGAQAVVHNGSIYLIGGYVDEIGTPCNYIQIFNPSTLSWQIADTLQTPRAELVADIYRDSLFVAGGVSNDSAQGTTIEAWNFSQSPTVYDENAFMNRLGATGGIFYQNLYLFGGYSSSETQTLPFIIEYNLPSRQITFTQDDLFQEKLPYQQMSAVVGEKFYLFGGVYFGVSNRVYQFSVLNRKYERTYPNLSRARAGGQAVLTPHNNVYIVGGYNESESAIDTVEVYHIESWGNWVRDDEPLNTARREMAAAFYDDKIYVFGGKDAYGNLLSSIETLNVGAPTAVEKREQGIHSFRLYDNYPNPFNTETVISFDLVAEAHISLEIYSITGMHIKTLANGIFMAGHHRLRWDGKDENNHDVPSGAYLYRLASDSQIAYKKMMLIR